MDPSELSSIDPRQKFEKVIIESPLGQSEQNNVTFLEVQQTLNKDIQSLLASSFYKQIDVHLAARSNADRSFIDDKYTREENVLKMKIQQNKRTIFRLSKIEHQEEFDEAMKAHHQNMDYINFRAEQVEDTDFVPVVHIRTDKKKPYYGHLMQEFTRKGAGVLNLKMGFRAPFDIHDTLELKMQTPITSLKRKYFNFDFEWKNPHRKYGNIFARYSHANESLFEEIDEKSHSFNLGFDWAEKGARFEWENRLRAPIIAGKFDHYFKQGYHLPSSKSSFKFTKTWENSIQFNDIHMGKYLESAGEVTVPFASKSHFMKFETNYRQYYDPLFLKKYFDNSLMKKLLYGSSLETNASLKCMLPFSKKYVSDVSENMEIRGFDQPRRPNPSYCNFKTSAKFNIHDYPVLSTAKIVPFLFAQSGLSFLDVSKEAENRGERSKLYGLGSLGLGVAYHVNPYAQIELIYCLGQYQNAPRREPTNFQIRIGVFD